MTLVMFDMDGTLIDTQALIAEHMATTFEGGGPGAADTGGVAAGDRAVVAGGAGAPGAQ